MLASGHAALETVCQIGVANFVEDFDDLLLLDICEFHFVRGCHVGIYVVQHDEPDYRLRWWVDVGVGASVEEVVGTFEPDCLRDVEPARSS